MMNWLHKLFSNPSSDPLALELYPVLGFCPENIKFYHQAFCHSSIESPSFGDNERLEFLGDSILDSFITEYLYHQLPTKDEGVLTDMRSKMVSRRTLNKLAKEFKIETFVQTNLGGKIPASILGNSFEALIAAIYYDKSFEVSEKFILKMWKNFINLSEETIIDSKTKLQEYSLKKFKSLPIYKLVSFSGPKHKPKFLISVRLKDTKLYDGSGDSKKIAEQNAAKKLLDSIK